MSKGPCTGPGPNATLGPVPGTVRPGCARGCCSQRAAVAGLPCLPSAWSAAAFSRTQCAQLHRRICPDTSPLEASQRSALSRRRSGLWRQRSHRARPHSGRDRAARRTAARAVHVYPANNRGGAARRRVVIGTTWPRRRRKSAAARMTPGRRWAIATTIKEGKKAHSGT